MITIKGQTNVTQLRSGTNAALNLGKELGKFVVTTMEIPWKHTHRKLGGNPEAVIMVETMEESWLDRMVSMVETMEESWLDRMVSELPSCDTVVGVGGGQAIDAAKYISWKKGVRLVSIPTILSVDAFVTPAIGIRRNHEVAYVGESTPDPLVIDFEILRTAPPELNIAGIGDLISAHTGTYDWEFAQKKGRSEYPFSSADIAAARNILVKLGLISVRTMTKV